MIAENLLGDIFEECIPLFIALGDRTRLTILQCLFETQTTGEGRIPGLNVNEITDRTSLSRPAVSHHLKILKDTGLINVLRLSLIHIYLSFPYHSDISTRTEFLLRKQRSAR